MIGDFSREQDTDIEVAVNKSTGHCHELSLNAGPRETKTWGTPETFEVANEAKKERYFSMSAVHA
jgi:hypothetical protein